MYIYIFTTALLLATGQSIWKLAGNNFSTLSQQTTTLSAVLKTMFSVQFIAGAILYVVATAIYVWLFSKYSFFSVQVTLISTSVILSVLISYFLFKETPSVINLIGVITIIIGILLAIRK